MTARCRWSESRDRWEHEIRPGVSAEACGHAHVDGVLSAASEDDPRLDEIAAAVRPLRFWLTYSGFGARGERARAHLDAFEAELKGRTQRPAPVRAALAAERGDGDA